MRYHRRIAVSGFVLTLALAPWSAQAADIVQTLKDSGQFSKLADAIDKAGLAETLQGEGPFTVFAPTDEAFQKLQQEQGQQQDAQGQQQAGQDQQSGQSQQQTQTAQGQQQTGQSGQQGDQQGVLQQASSDQLKQILTHHVVEGKELAAQDLLGKEQTIDTVSGDQLSVDGTGSIVVLVPTGLAVSRVGDEVFVRREVAAMAQPAVTVSTTGQQGQQSGQQGQQQTAQSGQQSQQQAAGQTQGQERPMAEQQGLLRAAMVVEPGIEADNGVIHGIDQVLVPQKIEQQLMQGQAGSGSQQQSQQNQG